MAGGKSQPRRVIYTAVFGEYEVLNEQPAVAGHGIDLICFTEDPTLTSETWEVRVVEPRFDLDPTRSARWIKTRGIELLGDYDESLWIDNRIRLKIPIGPLLDEWLADADIAFPLHSFRSSVLAEFDAVAAQGYDDLTRVYEQLIQYSAIDEAVLAEKPYWTAVMARRHTPEIHGAMGLWADHILRFSRRDQLSVNFVLGRTGVRVAAIELDNHDSRWHEWLINEPRRWEHNRDLVSNALRPPSAELGRLQNQVRELGDQLDRERAGKPVNRLRGTLLWRLAAPLRAFVRPWRR